MNHTPNFQVINPLSATIQEGETIITQVMTAAERLQFAIRRETETYMALRNEQETYDLAEGESLSEVFALAALKEGPLAGIAKTSKEYDIALASLRGKLRGTLFYLWERLDDARNAHERAKGERAQAETEFAAMRRVAELKTAILRAATI